MTSLRQSPRIVSRWRRSLTLGAILAAVLMASSCSGPPTHVKPVERVRGGPTGTYLVPEGIHKIKHVIVIQQENRSFDSYFGTFPGADGIPMKDGSPTVCVADPATGACVAPYVDHADVNGGGPHSAPNATADIDSGKMDGFIGQAESGRKGCLNPTDPACTNSATPDVMGYHTESDIPNYWTYAKDFVLQDHMFEPNASWSLPSHLFLVSEWSAYCTQADNPSSCVNALQTRPAERPANAPRYSTAAVRRSPKNAQARRRGQPIYAWTDLTYLLHKSHVSWGYYVVSGTEPDCENPAAETCAPVRQNANTPGIWNPLPWFDTVQGRPPTRQHPVGRPLLRRREGRHPAGRVVGGAVGSGERASARPGELRAELCDQSDQRRHEEPGLGFDRHLPGLGRLGWLLRPRRPADGR